MDYYLQAFRQYADFAGTWTRTQYWMFVLINLLIIIAISVLENLIGTGFIRYIYSLVLFIPAISAAIRRLRDAGFSPWLLLLALIPVIGTIALIVLLAQPTRAATTA